MRIMFYIVDFLSVAFEALIISTSFGILCNEKYLNKLKRFFIYLAFVILISVLYIFVKNTLITIFSLFLSIILLSFLYDMNRIKQVLGAILLFVLMSLCEIIIGFVLSGILKLTVGQVTQNIIYYAVGMLVSKLTAFVVIKIMGWKYKSSESKIANKFLILFIVFPVVTFLVGIVLIGGFGKEIGSGLSIISASAVMLLVGANILVFYLFENYSKQINEQYRMRIDNERLVQDRLHLEQLISKQTTGNKTMHDLKNQLFALQEIVKKDKQKGIEKIDELCENVAAQQSIQYTQNISIDALINNKKQIMDSKDIKFVYRGFLSGFGTLDEIDLCIVLGNLLDNAIEASIKLIENQKLIKLELNQRTNYLNIKVENFLEEKIQIEAKEIATSKKDKMLHGFGLKSVKEIAAKYLGSTEINKENGKFVISVMLKTK